MIRRSWKSVRTADALMFISGFIAVAFIILTHVTIYNGWRHCYFAFPCIIFFAVFFLEKILAKGTIVGKYACLLLLGASFVYHAAWIVQNHPFEYAYFSSAFRTQASRYSGDYWGISSRALLEYITETDPGRMLLINHGYTQAGSINRGLLPEDERKYLTLTYDETDDVDYYIVCRDDRPSTDIGLDGFEKVFSVTVDEDEIGAVYKNTKK